jgi:hypothetical protein
MSGYKAMASHIKDLPLRLKKWAALLLMLLSLLPAETASAWDVTNDVKVTAIELTYMPDNVVFIADRAIGSCAAGGLLGWVPRGTGQSARDQNAQAVLAALMSAKASGASIRLFVTTSTCQVEHIYLL